MTFRRSAPAILVTTVVLVVSVVSVVSSVISHRMAASFEEAQFLLMGQILQAQLKGAETKAIAAAESVAAVPSVRQAFAARNREALLALTRPGFAVQKEKYGISQAQFHLPPAVSFLRVHNPAKFGEDQSNYRHLVVEANRTQAIRKGTEITTSGIGIFGTLPLTDETGAAIGSFEMAYEFGPLLDEMKNAYGFELGFFVDEKMLRETATSLSSEAFSDQNRFGSHVIFHSTHSALLRDLVPGGELDIQEPKHYLRESTGVPYGVLLQPVYNYAGKQIGAVAVARSFATTRSADGQALVWQTLLGVAAAILLAGGIVTVIRGLLLGPLAALGASVAASAAAGGSTAIEAPEGSCDEVRELAGHCERLRARTPEGQQQ